MSEQKTLEDLIKGIEIFQGLETRDINKVLKVASGKKYESGEIVFSEGDLGDSFYLIIEGSVRVEKKLVDGKIGEVASLRSGDYFGEMSLLDGEPRSATVMAAELSKLLEIKNSQFIKIIMNDDNFARKVLWAFCTTFARRLRATNMLLANFAQRQT
ncbi:MAG: cyclic nucleotide-binding domain-containing protein [Bacteroidetes bacterium]|nr:cyclic nucleotide-binding domain-containing protein [Bacteroidota bacterium]